MAGWSARDGSVMDGPIRRRGGAGLANRAVRPASRTHTHTLPLQPSGSTTQPHEMSLRALSVRYPHQITHYT